MSSAALTIRPLDSPAELRACLALQDATWGAGFSERVPYAVLWFTRRIGGVLLGAFDGTELVGFVFGVTGWRDGRPVHWSDMLAVRSDQRDRGIGVQLKAAQRQALLAAGVQRAQWTFDPLESRNAYVNLARLGAIAREYVRDVYGESDSPLHSLIGTDRLIAEWPLASARVEHRLAASHPPRFRLDTLPAVNQVTIESGIPVCGAVDTSHAGEALALLVPASIQRVKDADAHAARTWRACTRAAFEAYFHRGYVATEVVRMDERLSGYVLERDLRL